MKTLRQFLEQGEPQKEDPKVKQAEKRENMLKRRVLTAKMRAVRGGATGIMASHEPEGEIIEASAVLDANKELSGPPKPKRTLGKKVRRAVLLNMIKRGKSKSEIKHVMHGEGVMKFVKSIGRKKTAKKPTMDSTTAKLHDWRKKHSDKQKEHEKYVNFLPVDEGIRRKIKVGMRLAKREAERLVVDDPGNPYTYGSLGNPKPGDKAKRDKERAAKKRVKEEVVNERTLSSYIPSDRQGEAHRANLDYMKAQLKKKEDESTKNRGDLSKRDAGKMARERLRTKKIKSLGEEDKAFKYVLDKLKKQHGDGVLTKGDKIKPPTPAQKKAAAAHRKKVDRENAAEFKKDPSQGRYPRGYSNRGSD